MKLTPKVSQKIQMKTVLVFTGAGIALASIIGVLVFLYLNTGNTENALANATYTSRSLGGPWTTASTWNASSMPSNNPVPQNSTVIINANDPERDVNVQDLYFRQNATLDIFGILVVKGNFTMEQGSNLIVRPGGVLIVMGNYSAEHQQTFVNSGRIILLGNITTAHQSTVTNTGTIYADAHLPITSGSSTQPESGIQNDAQLMSLLSFHGYNTSTLPVTLLSFTAKSDKDLVTVRWSTANEKDNDFFTIERSRDGKNFEIIGTEDGSGTSLTKLDYTFYDEAPLNGKSFYRLKQTDFNGEFEYFSAVSVDRISANEEFNITSVWPNPFSDRFTVNYTSAGDDLVELHLVNAKGETVLIEKIVTEKGKNTFEFNDGHKLNKEIFFLRLIQTGKSTKSLRLIKK